jgi:hemoglobin-like flavoprotein
MLTTQQKTLVQESWRLVQPISDQAAELFYRKLFELDPSLRQLFKGDMQQQGAKLMKTIGMAVATLNDFARLEPVVQALGQRHVGYGVKTGHYGVVGEALLWTLERGLGAAATPAVLEAWAAVYGTLSSVMIAASEVKVA